jgi:uncharacterized membrane protein
MIDSAPSTEESRSLLHERAPALRSLVTPARAVYVITAGWIASFAGLGVLKYLWFFDRRFDLGNMTQAVWSTAHGRPLETTEVAGDQITRLAVHVDPLLAAIAPLWLVWPSPLLLVALQAAAIGIGALPVFWLARKHLASDTTAALLGVTYLLYPSTQWAAINEFEPLALGATALLFAIWFLDEDRLLMFAVVAVLAAASGEMMGFLLAGLGVWYALRKTRWRVGGLIMALGASWSLVALQVVIRHFSRGPSPFGARYAAVGGSPEGFIATLVTNPTSILGEVVSTYDGLFALTMSLPLLGLFALAPSLALVAAPQVALSVFSERPSDLWLGANVVTPVIPFLVAATVLGVARLGVHRARVVRLVLASTLFCSLIVGPASYLGRYFQPENRARAATRTEALGLIPADAAVSSTNHLGSHLSARRYVYSFPVLGRATWVAVDRKDPWLPPVRASGHQEGYAVAVRDLEPQPERLDRVLGGLRLRADWRVVYEHDDILVMRRLSP